jgi:D-alanyl-D-alanine carboxypeptidase
MIAENTEAPPPSRSLARPAPAAAAAHPPTTGGGFALSSTNSASAQPSAAPAVQGPPMVKNGATGSTDPIKPIAVKTVKVKTAPMHTAELTPAAPIVPVTEETKAPAPAPAAVAPAPVAPAPAAATSVPAPLAAAKATPPPEVRPAQPALALQAEPARPPVIAAITPAAEPVVAKTEPAPARSTPVRTGWIVQVGAFASESEAKQHLDEARSKAKTLLGRADPFTEAVLKDDKTYFRARFSGLDRDKAEAVCKQLRRNDIACMTVKN